MAKTKTSFKKGEVHNPYGRPPKGYSITEMMRTLMETTVTNKDGKEISVREALGKSVLQKALKGDTTAQKLIWQYMDGLPMQKTDITTGGEKLDGLITYRPERQK